jgi:dolichol-phosphate mannosyltransferase
MDHPPGETESTLEPHALHGPNQLYPVRPELGMVLPSYDERGNIVPVLTLLRKALRGIRYEVILVDDDSEDGTADHARAIAANFPELRVIQRINRSGLASACLEGMMASHAPYLAIMDCDLQHDEQILPEMLSTLKRDHLDIVIGTRHAGGGGVGEFAAGRQLISNAGRWLSQLILKENVSDPMSGFFVLDRAFLEEVVRNVSGIGYKILLDLLASSHRPVRYKEVGYIFRSRIHGTSKLDLLVALEYFELLLDKLLRDFLPARFVIFCLIGSVGLIVNLLLFTVFTRFFKWPLDGSYIWASAITVAVNYALNNQLTFRRFRLKHRQFWTGLIGFYAACAIGLFAGFEVASGLRTVGMHELPAVLAGVTIGSVWNYCMSSILVWRVSRRRARQFRPATYLDRSAM